MTTDQMRNAINEVYPGPKWTLKCQTMPDRQVIAIYKSLQERGRLCKKRRGFKRKEPGVTKAIQITMFDICPSLFLKGD